VRCRGGWESGGSRGTVQIDRGALCVPAGILAFVMALTDEQRQRIREEEIERLRVRNELTQQTQPVVRVKDVHVLVRSYRSRSFALERSEECPQSLILQKGESAGRETISGGRPGGGILSRSFAQCYATRANPNQTRDVLPK